MQKMLTTKTWHVVNGAMDVAVTPEMAEEIKDHFARKIDQYETDDGTVIPRLGTSIMPPFQYEDFWHRRNGETKCKFNNWHMRGEKCECWATAKSTGERPHCSACDSFGYVEIQTGDPMYPRAMAPCLECNKAKNDEMMAEHESKMRNDQHYRSFEQQAQQRKRNNPDYKAPAPQGFAEALD